MSNEKVWMISDNNSKTLSHILVKCYFSQEVQDEIKVFDDINTIEDLNDINLISDDQIVYYSFESVALSENIKNRCQEKNIKFFDIYGVVYNYVVSLHSKIAKGGNVNSILDKNLENNAVDFTLTNDDGANPESIYNSDIVIIGISRTSKTPLSIYLSNSGYKVTNIPLVPEIEIPEELFNIAPNKIVALTMDSERLIDIRRERLKYLGIPLDSEYASKKRVNEELAYSKIIIDKLNCKSIDVTHISIEETAEKIKNYVFNKEEC